LAAGYLGWYNTEPDLFLSGAFQDSIIFYPPGGGAVPFVSAGDYDIFAVRFPLFDITKQDAVTAGGPHRDQALAISDNGNMVGGFVSDSANFNGVGNVGTLGDSPWSSYSTGKRETGFLAIPDYDNLDWDWLKIIPDTLANGDTVYDSQVNTISTGNCDDVYVGWNRGMHPEILCLPHPVFIRDHLYDFASSTSDHFWYSKLSKWLHLGTSASQVWEYDFFSPSDLVFNNGKITSRYITDIEIADPKLYDYRTDVILTGRFGDSINIDTAFLGGPNFFWPNFPPPYEQGLCGMFIIGLEEHPKIYCDTYTVCLSDSIFQIELKFSPDTALGAAFNVDSLDIFFHGDGIIDSVLGLFDPAVAGLGFSSVIVKYNYYGCDFTDTLGQVEVYELPFPKHPLSEVSDWAEGMGVAGLSSAVSGLGYDIYYNSGRYQGDIGFEKHNTSNVSLTSAAGIHSGYVSANGPCGTLWATNFKASGVNGTYVEALEIHNGKLYASGAVHGSLQILDTLGSNIGPASAINSGINLSTNFAEKGFVAQMDMFTGAVNWIYLGGNTVSQTNRFHGLALFDSLIAVIGEFKDSLTGGFSGSPFLANSSTDEDVVYMLLETNGNELQANSFGTADNDHGDAIKIGSVVSKDIYVYGIGDIKTGAITHGFNNCIGTSSGLNPIIFAGDVQDVFLFKTVQKANQTSWTQETLKVYEGLDADYGMDLVITDYGGQLYAPNDLIFCGQFTDNITTNNGTTTALGALTDGFVGSTDVNLIDNWFSQEGSISGELESFNALEFSHGKVFGVGKFQYSPTTMLLGSGTPFNVGFFVGLFTLQFDPNGGFNTKSFADPNNTGSNEHLDICSLDSSMLTTGFTAMTSVYDELLFYSIDGILKKKSINHEAFVARIHSSTNAFYKKEHEQNDLHLNDKNIALKVAPNPNNGSFDVLFSQEFSGELAIYASNGQLVLHKTINKTKEYPIQNSLVSGLYIIYVTKNGLTHSCKFIVD